MNNQQIAKINVYRTESTSIDLFNELFLAIADLDSESRSGHYFI